MADDHPAMPWERCFKIEPPARHALVDLRQLVPNGPRGHYFILWWSAHTTAGFVDEDTLRGLSTSGRQVRDYLEDYRKWFPPDAGYSHDDLTRRADLSARQRLTEPRNADAHLTFIAAGLQTCVTYDTRLDAPWYLIELDGQGPAGVRHRTVRAVAFDRARVVTQRTLHVPIPHTRPATVSMGGPGSMLYDWIEVEVRRHSIRSAYVQLMVRGSVEDAALTVNEYEPLLMHGDLPSALDDASRFGRRLEDRHASSSGLATLCAVESTRSRRVEAMQLRRSIRLLVSDVDTPGTGRLIQGQYQCPILIARSSARATSRAVDLSIHELL